MRLRLLFTALLITGQVGISQAGVADSLLQLLSGTPHASTEQRAAWASQLGHNYADRYRYDSALALYAQALAGYQQAGNQEMAFDVLFDLGYTHYAMYEYSRALEFYHESLELAESLNDDSLRAVAYDWISLQYLYSGAYGQAITNQLSSIRIREARKDSAGLAESFYSMGDILSHQQKLEESNAYFRRCIRLASRFDQKSLLLGAYGTIGAAFIDQNQWDSAFWYNRVALRIAQRNEMDYGIAFANGALGKCYLAKNKLDSAETCYRRSLEVALKMSEHSEISHSLLGLGLLAQRKGDTEQALANFREGLKVGQAYALTDVEEEAYGHMAETFHLAGMHDSAYAYQLKLIALKDTLFADRSQSMVSTLEARYGILQNEADQQALLFAKDRQIKTLTMLVGGVGALLTLGFLWFSYYNYRNQRSLNAVLENHNQTMEEQNEKLTLANEDLKQFAYAASHDLKQPLRTIGNFSTLIERKFKPYIDEDTEDYFQYIQRAVRDMSSLLTNLLQYTQLENKAESFEALDMNDVLATVTNNLSQLIQERKANVMAEYLPNIMANREHMIQLFQNLINNALKFNDKLYPEVLISYTSSANTYCFSIHDNGIGIDPAYQDKIFGLFQRVGDKEVYEGSGMGLAITKRIVRQYQGDIWVESKPHCGSTFHFTIPLNA